VGKQIRCPKCGAVVEVPALVAAEEVSAVDAKVVPVRPRPVDDGDEDEDTGEARPRKKKRNRDAEDEPPPRRVKKRRAAKRGSGGGAALAVTVGLLLAGGVAVGAFLLARKGPVAAETGTDSPSEDPAQKPLGFDAPFGGGNPLLPADPPSPVPAGWQQYDYPDAGFKAYFPRKPIGGGAGSGESTGPGGAKASWTNFSYFSGGYSGADNGVTVKFWVFRFSNGAPVKLSNQLDFFMPRRAPGPVRPVRWLGHEASEFDQAGSVVRVVSFGNNLIAAQVVGRSGLRAQPNELAGFFTNVELTK
jgi:hypothetical protein